MKSLIIEAVVLALLICGFTFAIKPVVVKGDSMNNTLRSGNYLMVNKMSYRKTLPKRGDIIVFKNPTNEENLLIKRIIAVEGEKIVTNGKTTFINEEPLDEPYVNSDTKGSGDYRGWIVPTDHVFVMGDNRDDSLDSRTSDIGFVDKKDILGKVITPKGTH